MKAHIVNGWLIDHDTRIRLDRIEAYALGSISAIVLLSCGQRLTSLTKGAVKVLDDHFARPRLLA